MIPPRFLTLFLFFPLLLCADGQDLLLLRSGASLQGAFQTLQGSEVRFHPRWSQTKTRLPTAAVEAVFFGIPPATGSNHAVHRITFTDGDRLTGRVTGRGEEILRFEIAPGTVLRIRKESIETLETLPVEADLLIADAMDASSWQAQGGRDVVREGRVLLQRGGGNVMPMNPMPPPLHQQRPLEARAPMHLGGSWYFPAGEGGTLVRELPPLPARFRLAYAVRPPENPFMLSVVAFSAQPMQRAPGSMVFAHQNRHVQGQSFPEEPGGMGTWREQNELLEGEWQRYELYVDRTRGLAWMYLNGKRIQEWRMTYGETGELLEGRWLSFQIQHNAGGVQLGDIQLSRWDGAFPGRALERFGKGDSLAALRRRRANEAEIRLNDHTDLLTLEVREITETAIVARGEPFEGPVVLPRERVIALRFPWRQSGPGAVPGLSIDLDTPILQLDPF